MTQLFRATSAYSLVLTVLIMFAIGPGLTLHAIGDLHHARAAHAEHHLTVAQFDFSAHEIEELAEHTKGDEHACSLEHDHDKSHATGFAQASIVPPGVSVDIVFDGTPVVYSVNAKPAPPPNSANSIDKPPRLASSI